MTDLIFQVKKEKENQNEGVFAIEPLEAGFGQTVGNALRRVILTSLPGAAVTFVKINGVRHQFTSLPGLKEDIAEFILNVKKLRIKMSTEGPAKMTLEVTGPGAITAAKIQAPSGVEVVNKDLVLGNLADKKAKLSCEITVEKGFGYSPFEERKSETLGVIPVDAIFSPAVRVNYHVETTRVGRVANYDRLVMEVTTDGTMSPQNALEEASRVLVSYFNQIYQPRPVVQEKETGKAKLPSDVLKLSTEELSLPTRIVNVLEKNDYKTVGDLVGAKRKDLVKIKNLGEKSLKIIDVALAEKGVKIP
ncbi:MAG: DNA-directed RNA polymerase subunit alpha [Candidatus Curtissbacteria bacterium]|nr:DNA-directed RNA polymerase subunit alpha [bacterium]MDZ4209833.1 DNA-directed RNA polymerase subunit alpha [Candidatus Curtissbacteria bacterium]